MAGSSPARPASSRAASVASRTCSPAATSRRRADRSTSGPYPASAAGPDLREIVLGSEGRLGILTDVTVRATAAPKLERFSGYLVPDWDRALLLARRLAQSGLPLSMVRVSTPLETATTFALAGDGRGDRGPPALPRLPRDGSGALPRDRRADRRSRRRRRGGQGGRRPRPRLAGHRRSGHRLGLAPRPVRRAVPAQRAVGRGLRRRHARDRDRLDDTPRPGRRARAHAPPRARGDGERVHAFSHLSHGYPSGSSLYVDLRLPPRRRPGRDARALADAQDRRQPGHRRARRDDQPPARRRHRPRAVPRGREGRARDGRDRAPLVRTFDPDGRMARGILLEDGPP